MRENPYEVSRKAAGAARDAFIRAAAALTGPINRDAVAFALVEAGLGLAKLTEADQDKTAKKQVLAFCRAVRARGPGMLDMGLVVRGPEQ